MSAPLRRRRELLLAASGAVLAPSVVFAQPRKLPRVVWISMVEDEYKVRVEAALKKRGLVDGTNISLEIPGGRMATDDARLRELVASRPDVIVVLGAPDFLQAHTREIPVIFYNWNSDPVKMGLVESFRRPGTNMTGVYLPWSEIQTRQWQLLKDFNPSMKAGCIVQSRESMDEYDKQWAPRAEQVQKQYQWWADARRAVEKRLAITLREIRLSDSATRKEIEAAVAHPRADALRVENGVGGPEWRSFVRNTRIPTCCYSSWRAKRGMAIVGVSFNWIEGVEQAAERVALVLRGENPATIPIYIIREFSVTVNMGLARAAGIRIPASVLLQAAERYDGPINLDEGYYDP